MTKPCATHTCVAHGVAGSALTDSLSALFVESIPTAGPFSRRGNGLRAVLGNAQRRNPRRHSCSPRRASMAIVRSGLSALACCCFPSCQHVRPSGVDREGPNRDAIEFRADNPQVMHHANVAVDSSRLARRLTNGAVRWRLRPETPRRTATLKACKRAPQSGSRPRAAGQTRRGDSSRPPARVAAGLGGDT